MFYVHQWQLGPHNISKHELLIAQNAVAHLSVFIWNLNFFNFMYELFRLRTVATKSYKIIHALSDIEELQQ